MKYIGITEEHPIEQENRLITALLDNGLDLIHLRKPKYSGEKTEQLLLSIPPRYYDRIVLHDHFELAEKYRDPAAVLMRYNGDSKAFSYQQGKSEISGYAKDVLELCKSLGGEPDIVFFYKADDTQSFTFGRNISGI